MTKLLVALVVLCLATLLLGASEERFVLAQLSPDLSRKVTEGIEKHLGIDAEKEIMRLMYMPDEILLEVFEYMTYEDWLIMHGIENNRRLQIIVQNAVVSEMVILPGHVGKPIPPFLASVCASVEQGAHPGLVISRLGEVLKEATGIKSISLSNVPIGDEFLELIYLHEETLERLLINFRSNGGSFGFRRGWLKRFKNLRAFGLLEFFPLNIDFPTDFEPLTKLVYLYLKTFGSSVPLNAFQYLSGLRYLKLQINHFPTGIFRPLVNLRVLNLERQKMRVFGQELFEGLTKLEKLVIPGLFFYSVPGLTIGPGAFLPLERLVSVNFSARPFPKVDSNLVLALWRELGPMGFILAPYENEFIKPRQNN